MPGSTVASDLFDLDVGVRKPNATAWGLTFTDLT